MKKQAIAMLLTLGMFTSTLTGVYHKQNSESTTGLVSVAAAEEVPTGSAITVEAPSAPKVTQIKGGTKRVKLYWEKVKNASGYYVYYSTSLNGTYTRAKTITDPAILKYVKKSLVQNTTYYFKISSYVVASDGTKVEGEKSSAYSAKTVAASATSKGAKTYSTLAKFKKSAAYKKFGILKKANYTKSFAIPGTKTANVAGFNNKKMIPQGACVAGAYMLISAFAKNGEDESVIYILSRSSKSYITTLVMPNKTKLNALAYDGENVWVTQGKKVSYFSYENISKAVAAGSAFTELAAFDGTYDIATTGAYMAYRDNILWVGEYHASLTTKMYGYELGKDASGKPTLTQKLYMTMPTKTHAVSFDDEGYMYVTRSSQVRSSLSGYMSHVKTFKPDFAAPTAKGCVKKGSSTKKVKMPPMAVGSMVYGQYLYTVFSGCKYTGCTYKVDRVIAVKRSLMQ
ncbi:MAG: fibronectin type III domain-containing protein [Lachnospiraceae bacterium]|nr:fibronectin type III domain-containing protein [Lachnospiraceae bacterium]